MSQDKLKELRDYYDNTDQSEGIAGGDRQTKTTDEVLVSTSIRLPQWLMERVRAQAEEMGIPATALIRQWVIEKAEDPSEPAVVSVADLRQWVAEHGYTVEKRRAVQTHY